MKEVFKVGDKVYHIQYGWGVISESSINDILVDFKNKISAWVSSDGNLLSFTEYTLQGFSQERPIILPEVGELCLVSNSPKFEDLKLGFFKEYKDGFFTAEHHSLIGTYWKYLKRIKILD